VVHSKNRLFSISQYFSTDTSRSIGKLSLWLSSSSVKTPPAKPCLIVEGYCDLDVKAWALLFLGSFSKYYDIFAFMFQQIDRKRLISLLM
jgi:hypothetical protein